MTDNQAQLCGLHEDMVADHFELLGFPGLCFLKPFGPSLSPDLESGGIGPKSFKKGDSRRPTPGQRPALFANDSSDSQEGLVST